MSEILFIIFIVITAFVATLIALLVWILIFLSCLIFILGSIVLFKVGGAEYVDNNNNFESIVQVAFAISFILFCLILF